MITSTNILITGSNGFIGSNLLKRLFNEKNIEKLICYNRTEIVIYEKNEVTKTIHKIDFSCLTSFFAKIKIDIVYHLATKYVTDHKTDQINQLIDDNVGLTTKICECVKSHSPIFINACSYWQFDSNSENKKPNNLYAATKNASDAILQFYSIHHNFKLINAVIGDTYGINDHRDKLLYKLIKSCLNSESITLGDPTHTISLTHVSDIIDGLIKLPYMSEFHHKNVNLISETEVTLEGLVNIVENCVDKKLNCKWLGTNLRSAPNLKPWRYGVKFNKEAYEKPLDTRVLELVNFYKN